MKTSEMHIGQLVKKCVRTIRRAHGTPSKVRKQPMSERLTDVVYLLNGRRETASQIRKLESKDGKEAVAARLEAERKKWAAKDRRLADEVQD